jgi:hypothetical protein
VTVPVPDRSPWPLVAAGLAVFPAIGMALGVVGDVLSPSLWLDLVALWPLPVLGSAIGLVVWLVGGRRRRHLAIIGLSAFSWLVLGLALHLAAAPWLPVASAAISRSSEGELASARIGIDVDIGRLVVSAGADGTYDVSPLRTGGQLGAPEAYEQQLAGDLSFLVIPRADSGLFVFGGWGVLLGPDLGWTLELSAPELDIDLSGLEVASMRLDAEVSTIRLATPSGSPEVILTGSHTFIVPSTVAFTASGDVEGPEGWPRTDGGITSPAGSGGWQVSVEDGSTLRVVEG